MGVAFGTRTPIARVYAAAEGNVDGRGFPTLPVCSFSCAFFFLPMKDGLV